MRTSVVSAALGIALVGSALISAALGPHAVAQSKAPMEAGVLRYDANDAEIRRFKAPAPLETVQRSAVSQDRLAGLRLPVLAFSETPQLVRNALGADAKTIKPRTIIADADAPVWYRIVDNYGDITVTVDADLRINHVNDSEAQIHRRPLSLDGLKSGGKTKISIFDGAKEEGMEGVMVEYTVHKFPDIPYTVSIECRGATKAACRDVATITRDQSLLKLISVPR